MHNLDLGRIIRVLERSLAVISPIVRAGRKMGMPVLPVDGLREEMCRALADAEQAERLLEDCECVTLQHQDYGGGSDSPAR